MLTLSGSSAYETHFAQPDRVGAFMAEFALGSLATMARLNPLIETQGMVPYLGSRLDVHWNYMIILVIGIAAVHLLLLVGSIIFYKLDDGRSQDIELRRLRP